MSSNAVIIVHLLLGGFSPALLAASLNCPCSVVSVLDGNTVLVLDQFKSSRKIWLAGIEAPEMQQSFGQQSKQNLIRLVQGKKVDVEYNERDRYGRIVGKLLQDGHDMNLQQIKEGYAWHYPFKKEELSKLDFAIYHTAEQTAKQKQLGLWAFDAVPPWEYKKNNQQKSYLE